MKGLIFDYGGTLDTGGDHWSYIIYEAWQKAGIAAGVPEFREVYVYAERQLATHKHILPTHNFHDLLLIKLQLELQRLSEMGLLPPEDIQPKAKIAADFCYNHARQSLQQAIPVLQQLSQSYSLALVSNFYGNIQTVLKDFGVDKYFPHIVESSVVGVRKPNPEIFRLGCEALKLASQDVVVIGDSYAKDIEPARKAGCQAIWLKGKQWSDEEESVNYTPTISSLNELPETLYKIEQKQ